MNGRDGTVDAEVLRKLQTTVDDLNKTQVSIISDMKAAMTTIDALSSDIKDNSSAGNTIKSEVSAINESLDKAEASISETGVKLASLEKSIKDEYEKKIDEESKTLVAKIQDSEKNTKNELENSVKTTKEEIEKTVKTTKEEVENTIKVTREDIEKNVNTTKEGMETKIALLSDSILQNKTDLEKMIAVARTDMQKNASEIEADKSEISKNREAISETNTALEEYKTTVSSDMTGVNNKISGISDDLAGMKLELTQANEELRDQFDRQLDDGMSDLRDSFDRELSDGMSELRDSFDRELSDGMSDLRNSFETEIGETKSDVDTLKESVRNYMMSSEGHAKVDVMGDITLAKQAAHAEDDAGEEQGDVPDEDDEEYGNAGNTYYWEHTERGYRVTINSPYFLNCISVQIYYRDQENISPLYDVDSEGGVLTINISESEYERIGEISIQSIMIIHNADESTIRDETPDEVTEVEREDINSGGILHESGDSIYFVEDAEPDQ